MAIRKEISKDNELYLWMNGKMIYKRWLNTGQSIIIDKQVFSKYSEYSITDFDSKNTPKFVILKANFELMSIENGGRKTAINSGYRPDHVFEYKQNGMFKYAFMGDIQLDDNEPMMPGDNRIVTVRFLFHQPIDRYLNIGRKWDLLEGPTKIGKAEIIEILTDNI